MSNEQVRKSYVMLTNGFQPDVDAIGVILEIFQNMAPVHRRSVIAYINERFAFDLDDSPKAGG